MRLSGRLEHRLVHPTASLVDLDRAVRLATEYGLGAISVSPWLVKPARRLLGRSPVQLATVIGYPSGTQLLAVKAFETAKAIEQGAAQIDFVINAGALISREDETVHNDMLAVVDMAHSALASVGAIVDPPSLSPDEVARACRFAERAGVDSVVTSLGGASAADTRLKVALMRDSVGPRVTVKASGELREAADVLDCLAAGAGRVATVVTPALLDALAEPAIAVPGAAG